MYKTSTHFLKGQNPGISAERLLEYYKQELEYQSVNQVVVEDNKVLFKNNWFRFNDRYPNKFAGFLQGEISIEETDSTFIVSLRADISGLIELAGAVAVLSVILFALAGGFSPVPLIISALLFILVLITSYLSLVLLFPVYFASLRNDIERIFQNSHQSA